MKIRRKQGPRRLLSLTIKSLVLSLVVLVVIVYVVSFAKIIGSETKQQQGRVEQKTKGSIFDRTNLRSPQVLESAHDTKNLVIDADHGDHDKMAIEQLGDGEQLHEVAPVAVGNQDGEKSPVAPGESTAIGYAVTITGCGSDPITEGAAVLKHSIHQASIQGGKGRYDYKMYAIYHPSALKCAKTLEALGYTLVERETPVAVKDIQGEYLRSKIEKNGCCGEKELVKLEAYTLTQHPVIVHMDLDTLILQPMDGLFDWMLAGDQARSFDASGVTLQWPEAPIPETVNAFFTRDCEYTNGARESISKCVRLECACCFLIQLFFPVF